MCHLAKAWRVARGGLPAWAAWGYRADLRGIFYADSADDRWRAARCLVGCRAGKKVLLTKFCVISVISMGFFVPCIHLCLLPNMLLQALALFGFYLCRIFRQAGGMAWILWR